MAAKFHERFDIAVGLEEVRRRFVNRAQNLIFASLEISHMERDKIAKELVLTGLGDKIPRDPYWRLSDEVGEDFYRNLEALEHLYRISGRAYVST
jgi:hypothetical protein